MSHIFLNIGPEDMIGGTIMSHIFLFGEVKIGSNTELHCFVLQRKSIYSIKCVVYEIRRQHIFISENTILNKKNICEGL